MAAVRANKTPAWINFWATLLLLMGLFFAVRTAVNLFLFPKYPTTPSTAILGSLSGVNANTYTEDACQGDEGCLSSFKEVRNQSMRVDITNAAFFLFLGAGLVFVYKKNFLNLVD